MSGSDLLLTCSDCGQEFVFTAGEQQFFQERGYSSPRRCKPCRQAKQGGAPAEKLLANDLKAAREALTAEQQSEAERAAQAWLNAHPRLDIYAQGAS